MRAGDENAQSTRQTGSYEQLSCGLSCTWTDAVRSESVRHCSTEAEDSEAHGSALDERNTRVDLPMRDDVIEFCTEFLLFKV